MFEQISGAHDIHTVMRFNNTILVNSDKNAIVRFQNEDQGLASWQRGCGKIACTGKNNILLTDETGDMLGQPGQLLPPNNGNIINPTICEENSSWNGFECSGASYGVLRFKSTAWDARAKMNLPVGIQGETEFLNEINMMWEWGWLPDGDPSDSRL